MSKLPKEIPWITLHKAAKALGQTRHTVLIRCVAGELKARVIDGKVMLSRASLLDALPADDADVVEPEDADCVVA